MWRHPREGGDPENCLDSKAWVPAFAGMTPPGGAALPFPNSLLRGDDACGVTAFLYYREHLDQKPEQAYSQESN